MAATDGPRARAGARFGLSAAAGETSGKREGGPGPGGRADFLPVEFSAAVAPDAKFINQGLGTFSERTMNPKVSIGGSILTIIGGFLILLVGAVVSYVISGLVSGFHVGVGGLAGILVLGPVLGLLVIIVGVLALLAPDLNILWGVLAILLSIVSIFTTAIGGVFLGFILALVGGILILVKKAPPPAPMAPPMYPPMQAPPPPGGM